MIGDGRELLRTAWYLTRAARRRRSCSPCCALNLVGDGLNDALNPRLRDR